MRSASHDGHTEKASVPSVRVNTDENAVVGFAFEVLVALDGAVVLANWLVGRHLRWRARLVSS